MSGGAVSPPESVVAARDAWLARRGLSWDDLSAVGCRVEKTRSGWALTFRYRDSSGNEVRRHLLLDGSRHERDGDRAWGWSPGAQAKGAVLELGDAQGARVVIVAEGESDGLRVHALFKDDPQAVAVLVVPGASMVGDDLANFIGPGALVVVATDADKAGDDCAEKSAKALVAAGVAPNLVRRLRPDVPGWDPAAHENKQPDLRDAIGQLFENNGDDVGEVADALFELIKAAPVLGGEPLAGDGVASTEGQSPSGWQALDLVAALGEPPPEPDWLLEGFIEHGELVWLAGPGKVGKSLIALFLASAALAGAETFMGVAVDHLDWVVYVDGENGPLSVFRRIHQAGMAEDVAARIDYQVVRGVDLRQPEHLEVLAGLLNREGRGLLVLDSLVALHQADEDKAGEVRAFVTGLRAVAEGAGVTTIGLAHENRGGNLRGSLDWRNAADTVLELRKDDKGWRTLKVGDRRNGDEGVPDRVFRLVQDTGRLLLQMTDEAPGGADRKPLTKVEQVAADIVSFRRDRPDATRAETARSLGHKPDGWTFKNAWTRAMSALEGLGAETAMAEGGSWGGAGRSPYKGPPAAPAAPSEPLFAVPDEPWRRLDPDDPEGRPAPGKGVWIVDGDDTPETIHAREDRGGA